jgi:M6 family metalloprotease-like protein
MKVNLRTVMRIAAVTVVACLVLPLAWDADADQGSARRASGSRTNAVSLATFGYNTMTANGVRAAGERPLLLILMDFTDVRLGEATSAYEARVFGPAEPNVLGLFRENSRGRFAWTKAGVVRDTFPYPITEARPGDEARGDAIEAAVAAGFDFAAHDANGDGRVRPEELGIVLINATPPGDGFGGQAGPTDPPVIDGNGVAIEQFIGGMNDRLGGLVDGIAHELGHTLGTIDIYGSDCLSNLLSLYSCGSTSNVPVHFDPWHKMRLGWLEPELVAIPDADVCASLAPQYLGIPDSKVLLLYDPARPLNEFFLVEYRERGGYDAPADAPGVAVWQVITNSTSDFDLRIVEGVTGTDLKDAANWVLGSPPDTSLPGTYRGQSTLWRPEHGVFPAADAAGIVPITWFDGSDVGVRFKLSNATSPGGPESRITVAVEQPGEKLCGGKKKRRRHGGGRRGRR